MKFLTKNLNMITGKEERGGGSVKPYVIIKGGFSQSLRSLTEGGRGGQKSEKLPYVIYERPLTFSLYPPSTDSISCCIDRSWNFCL